MRKNQKPSRIAVLLLTKIATVALLLYCALYVHLPIGLLASAVILIIVTFITINKYKSMNYPKRVAFIGLTISAAILTILFTIKHYIADFHLNVLHIGIILLIPLLLYHYVKRRQEKEQLDLGLTTHWDARAIRGLPVPPRQANQRNKEPTFY